MARVRNKRLDLYCETIGDIREDMARLRGEESSALDGALKELRRAGISVYKHAKIELVRVPGEDKIRARLTKDVGDATTSDAAGGEDEAAYAAEDHSDDGDGDLDDLSHIGDL